METTLFKFMLKAPFYCIYCTLALQTRELLTLKNSTLTPDRVALSILKLNSITLVDGSRRHEWKEQQKEGQTKRGDRERTCMQKRSVAVKYSHSE